MNATAGYPAIWGSITASKKVPPWLFSVASLLSNASSGLLIAECLVRKATSFRGLVGYLSATDT